MDLSYSRERGLLWMKQDVPVTTRDEIGNALRQREAPPAGGRPREVMRRRGRSPLSASQTRAVTKCPQALVARTIMPRPAPLRIAPTAAPRRPRCAGVRSKTSCLEKSVPLKPTKPPKAAPTPAPSSHPYPTAARSLRRTLVGLIARCGSVGRVKRRTIEKTTPKTSAPSTPYAGVYRIPVITPPMTAPTRPNPASLRSGF